jgi:hypothetical protein
VLCVSSARDGNDCDCILCVWCDSYCGKIRNARKAGQVDMKVPTVIATNYSDTLQYCTVLLNTVESRGQKHKADPNSAHLFNH